MEERLSILIVEDEQKILTALKDFLEFNGFRVTEAVDGLEAERAVAENTFDLILLDLMLPKISGEQLCAKWRQEGLLTPVIMLTAKAQQKEKVTGLNIGADDYVTKPFALEELLARIKAVLRRTDPARAVGRTFEFADLYVNVPALTVKRDDQQIQITRREAKIIQFFAANPNRVISRQELYKQVWGETMTELGTRTMDMHIAKLRSKIEHDSAEPQIIKTVRGAGYKYGD
ncbi:MAG: response regulator transcription factor [Planctomycetota bacterium]|jgi:DNA-binding response OmpR family regulator